MNVTLMMLYDECLCATFTNCLKEREISFYQTFLRAPAKMLALQSTNISATGLTGLYEKIYTPCKHLAEDCFPEFPAQAKA